MDLNSGISIISKHHFEVPNKIGNTTFKVLSWDNTLPFLMIKKVEVMLMLFSSLLVSAVFCAVV
jgi:hypothetical protein